MCRFITRRVRLATALVGLMSSAALAQEPWTAPLQDAQGAIVMRVVMVQDEDANPQAVGQSVAKSLQTAMAGTALKAVVVSECFEDEENKAQLLRGICSVLGDDLVFGGATYGSFTQTGSAGFDSVALLGIGGAGVGVSASLVTEMGTAKLTLDQHEAEIRDRLHASGQQLIERLARSDRDRLLLLIPDAHSPKNRFLVEGVQRVTGEQFPITGGSVNKNAGQSYVYYRGQLYRDSAVALMLSGDFDVALSGRLAKDQESVLRTAAEGAAEALSRTAKKPLAVLAYNCAGRRGKLDDVTEELRAIQRVIGTAVPLFGCYNAGEIGPVDASERTSDALCGGSGWHVMFSVLGRD
jgi:hypothetical protein